MGNPTGTVSFWYSLVEQHRFDEATALWTSRMRASCAPSRCIYGRFANTTDINVRRAQLVSYDADDGRARVAVELIERTTSETRYFSGSWDLVRSGGRWLLDRANF